MSYDIRKTKEFGMAKSQWGREYYARDAMNWLVPVLFVPYFEWDRAGRFVPNWDTNSEGKKVRNGDKYISYGEVIANGLSLIWIDRKRILNKEWYHDG